MGISSLDLFLMFVKGDKRSSPLLRNEQKRKGIQIGQLDFPLIRYTYSLSQRVSMLSILKEKIHKLGVEVLEEQKEVEKTNKSKTNEKSIELIIYYESFLNQIYNIMENVSRINLFIFELNTNISPKFTNQMKQIKNEKLKFHPEYDKIKEEMKWYLQVHGIRSNANHFLTGANVFGRSEKGELILEYLNYNLSNRNNHSTDPFKIEYDILSTVDSFYNATIITLNKIADIYLENMDKDKKCHITFIIDGYLEIRELSCNELIQGELGKLIGRYNL
jgi:hypothetical protein